MPCHQSILRALEQLIPGEKHICLLGASSPIDQTHCSGIFGLLGGTRGPFLAAAAMVMWVLLAVGRWPLVAWCFHWNEFYIIVGIVEMYIPNLLFSGLKYLDCLNFIRGVPTPRRKFRLFYSETRFRLDLDQSKLGLNHLYQFWQPPTTVQCTEQPSVCPPHYSGAQEPCQPIDALPPPLLQELHQQLMIYPSSYCTFCQGKPGQGLQ